MAQIIQADARSKIAGAPLLPAADFDASAMRSRPAGGPDRTTYRTTLSASYEIDFWGKNRATSRAAQENAIAARFDRDVVAVSTVVSVATATLWLGEPLTWSLAAAVVLVIGGVALGTTGAPGATRTSG